MYKIIFNLPVMVYNIYVDNCKERIEKKYLSKVHLSTDNKDIKNIGIKGLVIE
jgi:hypothetical protein